MPILKHRRKQICAAHSLVDTFYEMITARVQYLDTSLNTNVKGNKHSTGSSEETERCRVRFQEPEFQATLLERSPELRALNRLYQVGKEVNRFQLEELRECSPEILSTF